MGNKKRVFARAIFAIFLVIGGGVIGVSLVPPDVEIIEQIVYVDVIVEVEKITEVEVIKYIERVEYIERIIYVDVPVTGEYYNSGNQIPTDMSVIEWLEAEWGPASQYEENGWDCSQMSAYVEFVMENSGYDTVIQTSNDHAWVLIELYGDGEYYLYETTGCYFPSSAQGYSVVNQFDDIYEVWDFYQGYSNGIEVFKQEWGWWLE